MADLIAATKRVYPFGSLEASKSCLMLIEERQLSDGSEVDLKHDIPQEMAWHSAEDQISKM